jgi:hypothetical protein
MITIGSHRGPLRSLGDKSYRDINPSSLKNTSLTRLEIPDQDGVWKEIRGKGPQ